MKECICDACLKAFGEKGTLSDHLKTVHGKAKAFKCDACLKEFSRRGYLNIHLNTVHGKAKGFRCYAYLKGFGQNGPLNRYLKTTPEKRKNSNVMLVCKLLVKWEHLANILKQYMNNSGI